MPRKDQREKYIKRGLCPNCGARPTTEGYAVCGICSVTLRINFKNYYRKNTEKVKELNKNRAEKYKKDGKCSCSRPLHPEADAGCTSCINCRERANL
jgi:hypothetical protein